MGEFKNIDIDIYKIAYILKDAIFEFGNPKLIEEYKDTQKITVPQINGNSILDILNDEIKSLQSLQAIKNEQSRIIDNLKIEIIDLIQTGELTALGLEMPISNVAKPVQILPHLFSGSINWDKSELIYKNLEISGIKIFKSDTKLNYVLENAELNLEKSKKLQFSDLNPEMHIDEKQAAELLGISYRTLQGYRSRGGGPEFIKIGSKVVRYKIETLIKWSKDQKKQNTI